MQEVGSSHSLKVYKEGRPHSATRAWCGCGFLRLGAQSAIVTTMHEALGFWILSAVVCVGLGHHHVGHTDGLSQVISGNKEFAFQMYRKLAAHANNQGKNIFYSPSSVSVSLAALSVGARGDTHQQLFNGLYYNTSQVTQKDVNQVFSTLIKRRDNSSDISEGTALFLDDTFEPKPEFVKDLKESFYTLVSNVNFQQTTESANTINKYVSDKTNGLIEKLVDSLDPNTIMYLVSHIYFKGKWDTPFETEQTKEDIFTVDENTKVPVQMMNKKASFPVYRDLAINTTVLRLPFNSSYSMLLLLPDNMAELEKAICPQHLAKWTNLMAVWKYDIFLPKFSIKTEYFLKEILIQMGMTHMFDGRADLSGISEGPKLMVSSVVHQATLDVDESGATAAGVTGIGITLTSSRVTPVLKFNRPFMLLITENGTHDILFLGKIINPNQFNREEQRMLIQHTTKEQRLLSQQAKLKRGKSTTMHAALGFWILSAVVCVGLGHHHVGHTDDGLSQVTSGNKEFAFQMYRKLAAHADNQGKNIFYSPSCVSVALAALSVGARGDTHQQLFNGLYYNTSQVTQKDVNQVFSTLIKRRDNSSDISEGTALFLDDTFEPKPEFVKDLKESYYSHVSNVNFEQTTESVNTINKYVSGKTNGLIEKLVDSLDPTTIMYLVSHIYFKGKWDTPFETEQTKEDIFTVDENTKVPVQMMNKEDSFHVYHDLEINTTVLRLPFNSSYSMLLLLPDNMAELEKAICPQHLAKWTKWMKIREYNIFLPKFSIKTEYSLKEILMQMGMTHMFDSRADLSGISEGQKLMVSSVVHQAALDVDESGATAAAATGIGITLMSLHHVPVLKFNRPFMLLITENSTHDILFLGKIINPNN
ncbi:uncharacterized protein LOC133500034 [Syngnathoides biaculeatus]|uniref:uncharacterized protein LOC133500034 n=1 Tax=Syngnathoides biaculeatus TaxID=300417 RepID=UPI002ADD3BBD|nr:uncharacterized protein LOC133500034 [Syngnathoides biaculeatus]